MIVYEHWWLNLCFAYFKILKLCCSYPQRVSKRKASVRHMFYNPEDVKWFKVKIHCPLSGFFKLYLDGSEVYSLKIVSNVTLMRFVMWVVISACWALYQTWSSWANQRTCWYTWYVGYVRNLYHQFYKLTFWQLVILGRKQIICCWVTDVHMHSTILIPSLFWAVFCNFSSVKFLFHHWIYPLRHYLIVHHNEYWSWSIFERESTSIAIVNAIVYLSSFESK